MKKILLSLLAILGLTGMANAQKTGTAEKPLSVADLIEQGTPDSPVANVYVKGYIVGWIDGMSIKTGAKFTVPCTVATNLILADSSSETDVAYCIPVQLPSGSVRSALNLVDHPENLGHEVVICGSNEKYFGANGMKSIAKYEWVGAAPVPDTTGYGPEVTGTAEKPLTVDEFVAAASKGTSIPNTYLKAVIVGYIPGKAFDGGVLGNEPVEGTNDDGNTELLPVSATNILVAATANPASLSDCIPVQLPFGDVRSALNLADNPSNLGKTVTLLGLHTPYFGVTGLKEVSEYAFGDEVIDTPTNPAGDAFYNGLTSNSDGWTFDNISISEDLNYVWSWDSRYNCLKASAFFASKCNAAESVAASPLFDLAGKKDITLTFEAAYNQFKLNNVLVAVDELPNYVSIVVREEGATEWTKLADVTKPASFSWDWITNEPVSLDAYADKKVQVGLRYISTSEIAGTWEVKNFIVNASDKNGVNEVVADLDVRVVGNSIVAPEGAQVFAINGVAAGTDNLAKGLYIVVVDRKAVKVVVK